MPPAAYKWQKVGSRSSWQCVCCQYAAIVAILVYIFHADVHARWNRRFGAVQLWAAEAIGWDDETDDGTQQPELQMVQPANVSRRLDGQWPHNCGNNPVLAIYPHSSEKRTDHMRTVVARIGVCANRVPAIMKAGIKTEVRGDRKLALYDGEVVFSKSGNKTLRGNIPNAATHFRMVNQFASTDTNTPTSAWSLFLEDDAQIQADVSALYSAPTAMADLLRWSFKEATNRNFTMITYGVCKARGSKCQPIKRPKQSLYSNIELSTCVGDYRCAHAYALPKWRASAIAGAYNTLNGGATTCPPRLGGGAHCPNDPFAFMAYLRNCRGSAESQPPCRALAVGTNFVSPVGDPVKKNQVGLFIQEKTKNFVKHYSVQKVL